MLGGEFIAAEEDINRRVNEILDEISGMSPEEAIMSLAVKLAQAEVGAQYFRDQVESMQRMRLGAFEHNWSV